jgi:methylthioribose-1-phosphate isomerase
MLETQKTLKQYAKEAKQRLKSGFWQQYKSNLDKKIEQAESTGVSVSKVKEYYSQRVYENIKKPDEDDETFYQKVKKILDEEGEISNAIGRLTDNSVYDNLPYEEKQRYSLRISERYLKAVERYKKENLIGV